MRKRIKEDKNELGVEIKIQSPKYKLYLLHEESIKQSYKHGHRRILEYHMKEVWKKDTDF